MALQMRDLLGELSGKVIGSIPYDPRLVSAALAGRPLEQHTDAERVLRIVHCLEDLESQGEQRELDRVE
jgi:CO dehydrogenase nickel-insertion accessory protein CooC1